MSFFSNIGKRIERGVNRIKSGGGVSNTLKGINDLADPMGVNFIGRATSDAVGQFLDPNYTQTSQSDLLKGFGGGPPKPAPPKDPAAKARMLAFDRAVRDVRRMRGVSTMLTGGTGPSSLAPTSSPTLSGV